jgi:hypothetical protein
MSTGVSSNYRMPLSPFLRIGVKEARAELHKILRGKTGQTSRRIDGDQIQGGWGKWNIDWVRHMGTQPGWSLQLETNTGRGSHLVQEQKHTTKCKNKFFIALQTRFTRIMEVTSLPHLIYWKENLVLSSLSLN